MADIDHFKKVNDTYGHDTGDEVLKAVARALCTATRSTDIIARLGGEEFLILIPGGPVSAGLKTAEHLRAVVEGK